MNNKSREVKSMRKDWEYSERDFWTVVQYTPEGLVYVKVSRAGAVNGDGDIQTIKSSSARPDQLEFAIKHTEDRAKEDFDKANDALHSSLIHLGFEKTTHEVDAIPLPEFAEFYAHNDNVAAQGETAEILSK